MTKWKLKLRGGRNATTFAVLGMSWALGAHGASFQGLGGVNVQGVSADGLYVVGTMSTSNAPEAFRWTAGGGFVGLGRFASTTPNSQGVAVSSDGAVVVGHSLRTNGFEAFRWTEGGGMVGLGELPGGIFQSFAFAVSAGGGGVAVGYSSSDNGREAFWWAGGMAGLGDLAQNRFESAAYGVSADGSVVVGYGYSASGPEAFRWTPGGGMVGLGAPSQNQFESRASGVSADGAVVVGHAFYPDSGASGLFQPFRWTQAGGMVKLGDLPSGVLTTYAPAVLISGNGAVVVGHSFSSGNPFIWEAGSGLRYLRDVLVGYGLNVSDWTLTRVTGISHDGLTIVGIGVRTGSGATEGWIARLGAGPPVPPVMQVNRSSNQVILSWPVSADAWKLQATTTLLESNSWTTISNTPVASGGRLRVAAPISGTGRFYRLKWP